MEGEGGRFRRSHCVPMPAVDSIDELNALVEQWDDADDRRRIGSRAMSVGHDWAFERQLLRPLPAEPSGTALTLTPRVDRYAQVMVRCCQYSVPARFIGHRVRVKLSASAVTVYDRNTVVARHQRAAGKGAKVLDLDHYLEILLRKPGALPGATALVQARASGVFTSAHDAFWADARKALGDSCWHQGAGRGAAAAPPPRARRRARRRQCRAGGRLSQRGRGRGRGTQSRAAAWRSATAGPGAAPPARHQPHPAAPYRACA